MTYSLSRFTSLLFVLVAAAASPCALQAQVFTPASGPGSFGSPYGYLGQGGATTWEEYRKDQDTFPGRFAPPVTASNVPGNNTQATYSNLTSGANSTFSQSTFDAPGVFINTAAGPSSSASSPLYLSSMVVPAGAPNSDANAQSSFDIRIGFVGNPSAFVANQGGDLGGQDLFQGNWGTDGAYLHLQGGNVGATVAGQPGNNWAITSNGLQVVQPTDPNPENGRTSTPTTQTLVNSGAAPANNGTPYAGPLEMSWKMTASGGGNVTLEAKVGNNLYDATFPASSFPDWATSHAVAFIGKANFSFPISTATDPATATLGVLYPGDANASGKVDVTDFNTLKANFGGADKTWAQGDFTQDGHVSLADFGVLRANYGTSAGSGGTVTSALGAGQVELDVNTTTGHVSLNSNSASISGLEITSAAAALSATGWNSLTNQGQPGFSEFIRTNGDLAEGSVTSVFSHNGLFDIGTAFTIGGAHDLVFSYTDANGRFITGDVVYTSSATPEPASLVLIALGAIGVCLAARRRRCG